MQEIVLILSSLVGIVAAAAVRKIPRDKNQLLSLGASSHIKSQISSLQIERDILTKTISRLYQTDDEFSKIQKGKLLLKYQHQLGIVLAKLEKLEQASNHPDLGPVGDGLITLMDQKLSKLDDRLYELSSKIQKSSEIKKSVEKQEVKEKTISKIFNFEKSKEEKMDSIVIPPTKSRKLFELTTLTNISRTESKFPLFEKGESKQQMLKPMPQPKIIHSEIIKSKEESVQEVVKPEIQEVVKPEIQEVVKPEIQEKIKTIQSITPNPEQKLEIIPDINKEAAKITEHKSLPEQKPKPATFDDDFDDDADDLDKIKGDIMKVLSKLDQAEVE